MPLSSFSLLGQTGCASEFHVSPPLDLFDRLIHEFSSIPHHVDFSATLRVRLWWRLVDWIYCGCGNSQGVIGFIRYRIQAHLPQLAKFVSKLCLIYEADSNWGWWEVAGAWSNNSA
jgi:hypothetical protein